MIYTKTMFIFPDTLKRYLQERLDMLVFVDDVLRVNAHKCNSCQRMSIYRQIANCNHIFCNTCFQDVQHKPCPVCKICITRGICQDAKFERMLLKLNIECPFRKNGCQDTILLGDLLNHEKKCKFSPNALLPKLYNEGNTMKVLNELAEEISITKSMMTKIENKLKELIFMEKQFNSIFETLCHEVKAINTELSMMAERFKSETEKRQELEKSIINQTEYNTKVVQNLIMKVSKELKLHIDEQLRQFHNQLFHHQQQSNGNSINENTYEHLAQTEASDAHPIMFHWTINNIKQKLRDFQDLNLESTKSKPFPIKKTGLKVRAVLRVDDRSGYLAISLEFLNNEQNDGQYRPLMYLHSRKYVLVDQREEKRNIVVVDQPRFRKNQMEFMMKERLSFSDNLAPIKLLEKDDAYTENDSIVIKVAIQPISLMYKSVTSNNGLLLWKIENYSKRKQDEADGVIRCLYSDSFYTHEMGYRVQGRIFLNGNGDEDKVKCISIYAGFLIGEYDKFLSSSFNFITTFHLLDQSDSLQKQHLSKQCERTYNEDYMFYGLYDFVLQSQAENTTYLKNDTLLIRIAVNIL